MLSRLARASHILSLFRYRIPTIATVLLHSRTPGSSPSLIRWHHSGRRTVSFASPSQDVADKQVNKSLRRSATHLSDEDYVDLADTYLEAVEEHAAYAKEEGLELTVEHQVWPHLLSIRCSHVISHGAMELSVIEFKLTVFFPFRTT